MKLMSSLEIESKLNKLDKIQSKLNHLKEHKKSLQKTKDNLEVELTSLTNKQELNSNVVYACKLLLEKLVEVSKESLEQFLTFALQRIFTDKNYAIKLLLKEESKRPGLELVLVEDGVEQPILDAVGGGILATLGLLLQIYYVEAYGLSKYMFIDEGLKEISKIDPEDENSKDYLNNVLEFLKWLSEERDYTFVIVTHDRDVIEKADKVYKVKNGEVYEV